MAAQRNLYLLKVGHALPVEQLVMTESSARNAGLRNQMMEFGHALPVEQLAMTGNSARIAERKEGNLHGEQE